MIRLVETIVTYRMRYLIDCESDLIAKDLVAEGTDSLLEFDQRWLGEVVMDVRTLTKGEALDLHENNADGSPWLPLEDMINNYAPSKETTKEF